MPEPQTLAHPPIASADAWLAARLELLEREKELTRTYDAINAQRRRLPMVKVEKTYRFLGPAPENQTATLLDLFAGQRQLIVYHFMFGPDWQSGCDGCTGFVDALGDLSLLEQRDTRLVLLSRAPIATLETYRQHKGWRRPWYSSLDTDFNYDFQATLDDAVAPPIYNYRRTEHRGEAHGLSVFLRLDGQVHHTYSTYARGCERLTDAYSLLDLTPFGRQEDFEDSPAGWPQRPTYG